jgi:ERCC4-type nuclease
VDDRIGSIELIPILQHLVPVLCSSKKYQSDPSLIPRVTSSRLLCGDVCFDGLGAHGTASVGIERKRVKDMLNSIRSGRYSGHQLIEMNSFYDKKFLFIEGMYRCAFNGDLEHFMIFDKEKKKWAEPSYYNNAHKSESMYGKWFTVCLGSQSIRYTELDHFLCTIQSHTSVDIRHMPTDYDTCSAIISLYTHMQEPYADHHSHQSIHVPQTLASIGKAGLVRKWAASLDGIGWQKSGQVALKFRTGLELANASISELESVKPGIGRVLAKRVHDQIRGLYKEKGEL